MQPRQMGKHLCWAFLVTWELAALPLQEHAEGSVEVTVVGSSRTLHSRSQNKILAGENEQFSGLSSGWVCFCWCFMIACVESQLLCVCMFSMFCPLANKE